MAIDVEAVCAEWRRLGGTIDRSGKSPILNGDAEDDGYDKAAAWVRQEGISAYFSREIGTDPIDLDDTSRLPELARVWGLTPAEPEVLTWEQAAALWVEWGGAVVRVSLTLGTLEDMAEACGLPRTPGARWAAAEQHARYKAALDAFCGVG
ncbi:hypothetical protein LCGC14_0436600 [marine sediment metagenome]|uniref:Uncharacterized protein n=1 Tax=marine sediment metagenome TaxID=412755 RepID=A0A0F9V8K1_9ZZZZ